MSSTVETAIEIRPFHVDVPQEELDDLRRRIGATRFADEETVGDQSQGVQSATIQELARYWATEYDWRRCEARLNAVPQFVTEIAGLPGDHPLPARLRAATLDAHGPAWTPPAQVQPPLPADPGTKPRWASGRSLSSSFVPEDRRRAGYEGWWRQRGRFERLQRWVSQGWSWWLPPQGSSPRGYRRRSEGPLSRRRCRRPFPGSRLGR